MITLKSSYRPDKIYGIFAQNLESELLGFMNQHLEDQWKIIDRLLNSTEKGNIVLEIGCGLGFTSHYLAENERILLCIDYSDYVLRLTKRVKLILSSKIQLIKADARFLPIKKSSVDCIFSVGVMNYFRAPKKILTEHCSILKLYGIMLIDVPNKFTFYTLIKKIRMVLGKWHWGWEREFTFKQLVQLTKGLCLDEMDRYKRTPDLPGNVLLRLLKRINKSDSPLFLELERIIPINIGIVFRKNVYH